MLRWKLTQISGGWNSVFNYDLITPMGNTTAYNVLSWNNKSCRNHLVSGKSFVEITS
jgi:hypothetical protein